MPTPLTCHLLPGVTGPKACGEARMFLMLQTDCCEDKVASEFAAQGVGLDFCRCYLPAPSAGVVFFFVFVFFLSFKY